MTALSLTMRKLLLSLLLLAVGCSETIVQPAPEGPPTAPETTHQAVVVQGEPNWLVAGGPGLVEMVGGQDGEPDVLTGRFVLDGQTVNAISSGPDRFIAVGNGVGQALGEDAVRLREARQLLSGVAARFIEPAGTGWIVGGDAGRLQLLDAEGEPTLSEIEVLDQGALTAAAFNGSSWMVGSSNGNAVPVNRALDQPANPSGNTVDGGKPITALAADPSGQMVSPAFLAFTADSVVPLSGLGFPQTPVAMSAEVTTAAFGAGKVWVGTSDGQFGSADYGSIPTFALSSAFSGAGVHKIVGNGTSWLALSDDGQARLFGSDGQPTGPAVRISTGHGLVGAHPTATGWLIVVGEIGFVAFTDAQLAAPRALTPIMGGAQINGAAAGDERALVVGAEGKVQALDVLGVPFGAPATVAGAGELFAAAWNGESFLVGGEGGFVALLDPNGVPTGGALPAVLGGDTVRFAAWSGEFFLVGGDAGKYEILRRAGTTVDAPRTLADAATLHDAQWAGQEWLMVGESATGTGFYAVVTDNPNDAPSTQVLGLMGPLHATDFNGLEWLVGGDGGLVQRVNAEGSTVGTPVDVLDGFDIRDLHFNGQNFLVVGAFGATRRLGQNNAPLRSPLAVLDRNQAEVALWTQARGFASGACITNDLCFEGPCVGGVANGKCCDAACDRPCESCFEADTGEADGTCAPVVAGKQPPLRNGGATGACNRQSEATCGFTGFCDGAGDCERHGTEIECGEALCSLGKFTPIATCDGVGNCSVVTEMDCHPYSNCTIEGCIDSCTSNDDCVSGYICESGACLEAGDEVTDPDGNFPDEPADEGGCCATIGGKTSGPAEVLVLLLPLLVWARRRGR